VLFGLWPILLSVQVSFTASATALRPDPQWVGLANYASVLADELFRASLWRTLGSTVLAVAANLGFALAAALLLDSKLLPRGNLTFRLVLFQPVVTPDVAGYLVWRWLFDHSFGAVNAALDLLGLPPFAGLTSVATATPAILIAELWHHAGFYMVIFLANLAIRGPALEEAAKVDGAGAWACFRHVILPQLRPAIIINRVYATIQFLKTFTVVVVMTKGGPAIAPTTSAPGAPRCCAACPTGRRRMAASATRWRERAGRMAGCAATKSRRESPTPSPPGSAGSRSR
jgi:ABC-type sugar transport system permease subunit